MLLAGIGAFNVPKTGPANCDGHFLHPARLASGRGGDKGQEEVRNTELGAADSGTQHCTYQSVLGREEQVITYLAMPYSILFLAETNYKPPFTAAITTMSRWAAGRYLGRVGRTPEGTAHVMTGWSAGGEHMHMHTHILLLREGRFNHHYE